MFAELLVAPAWTLTTELRWVLAEFATNIAAFLIFFWIMARFAWGPLMRVLDDRKATIEEGFADIERRQNEADRLQEQYTARLDGIETEARARIQEAIERGRSVADEIIEKSRQDASETAQRARRNLEIEIAKARIELRDQMASMVLEATERLLQQRVDEAADRRLVNLFLEDMERREPQNTN